MGADSRKSGAADRVAALDSMDALVPLSEGAQATSARQAARLTDNLRIVDVVQCFIFLLV